MFDLAKELVIELAAVEPPAQAANLVANQLINQAVKDSDADKAPVPEKIAGDSDHAENELGQIGVHDLALGENAERERLNARVGADLGLDGSQGKMIFERKIHAACPKRGLQLLAVIC
jgi:hypothetical protein